MVTYLAGVATGVVFLKGVLPLLKILYGKVVTKTENIKL